MRGNDTSLLHAMKRIPKPPHGYIRVCPDKHTWFDIPSNSYQELLPDTRYEYLNDLEWVFDKDSIAMFTTKKLWAQVSRLGKKRK